MYTQIKASWLHKQSYCEYQLYLMVCRNMGDPGTDNTLAGRAAHAGLDTALPAADVGVLNLADRVAQAQAKYQPFTVREVDVCGGRIYGRIDRLEYHLNHVAIIDNKPRPPTGEPYHGDRRQVIAYCMAFADQFSDNRLPVIARLQDYAGNEFWSHEFADSDRQDVDDAVDRILGILNGERKPIPAKINKCYTCYYRRACDATPLCRR